MAFLNELLLECWVLTPAAAATTGAKATATHLHEGGRVTLVEEVVALEPAAHAHGAFCKVELPLGEVAVRQLFPDATRACDEVEDKLVPERDVVLPAVLLVIAPGAVRLTVCCAHGPRPLGGLSDIRLYLARYVLLACFQGFLCSSAPGGDLLGCVCECTLCGLVPLLCYARKRPELCVDGSLIFADPRLEAEEVHLEDEAELGRVVLAEPLEDG